MYWLILLVRGLQCLLYCMSFWLESDMVSFFEMNVLVAELTSETGDTMIMSDEADVLTIRRECIDRISEYLFIFKLIDRRIVDNPIRINSDQTTQNRTGLTSTNAGTTDDGIDSREGIDRLFEMREELMTSMRSEWTIEVTDVWRSAIDGHPVAKKGEHEEMVNFKFWIPLKTE